MSKLKWGPDCRRWSESRTWSLGWKITNKVKISPPLLSAWKATQELRNLELLLAELKSRKEKDVCVGKTNA
jgi:hypothetical protein